HPEAVPGSGLPEQLTPDEFGAGELGAGELGVTSISMMTETTMPPGLTVSWQPTHTPAPAALPVTARLARPRSPPLTLTLTVVLWPASRRPEAGATDNLPIRPEDSVIDHDTGPPEAVSPRLPPDDAVPAPAADVPWLSALSWPWCVPNAPVSARMVSTAATTTTAAAAAPCVVRACHHADFGGSSGLGKPPGPDMTARCVTLAR